MPSQVLPDQITKYLVGALIAVAASIIWRFVLLLDRRRVLRFFSISRASPDVTILLSRMMVERTTGFEPIKEGFRGEAVLNPELIAAVEFRDFLKAVRVAIAPRRLQDWLGKRFPSVAFIDPKIAVGPDLDGVDAALQGTVISLGSPVYNAIAARYLKGANAKYVEFCRTEHNERAFRVKWGSGDGVYLWRNEVGKEVGIIERRNYRSGRSVFMCAGLGASATLGCARFLRKNWKRLHDDFGKDEFSIYLVFKNHRPNEAKATDPQVLVPVRQGNKEWVSITAPEAE
jgi:hypothetical protein